MQGRISKLVGGMVIILILCACTAVGFPTGVDTNPTDYSRTKTPLTTKIEQVPTATWTLFPTVIPVDIPTEGPPPDLELLNVRILYGKQGWGSLIGEIRNNTNTTIVFPVDIAKNKNPFLRLMVESWDWRVDTGNYYYSDFSVGKGRVEFSNSSCFLYPKETGILIIRVTGNCQEFPNNCVEKEEDITTPPEGIGMRLIGYEDLKTYIPWPDLYPDYHPQAENVSYTTRPDGIDFSFDLPKSFFLGYGFHYSAWVLLYDKDGGLISILYTTQMENNIVLQNGFYHVSGFSTKNYSNDTSFRNSNDGILGYEKDYTDVDHIRVFVESEHAFLCGTYTDYDIYRDKEKKLGI
jgi:hypothetical protein